MDPNLLRIDWARLAELLAALVVLSFLVERALPNVDLSGHSYGEFLT